nr:unnamed protein product [Callosobruchus analis]
MSCEGYCLIIRMSREESEQQDLVEEVTEVCDKHLGIKLGDRDILTYYRIGKKTNNKPRGLLVRFHSINTKQLICDKKKLLKGTGLVIKEGLTEQSEAHGVSS